MVSNAARMPESATDWWRDAVVYQVYIRSFADGDGDGNGDIAGLRSRLHHVQHLGVDAIWINPWYPSPMADGGYDVADYRDIEPVFGTLSDAEALIAERGFLHSGVHFLAKPFSRDDLVAKIESISNSGLAQ